MLPLLPAVMNLLHRGRCQGAALLKG